VPIPAQSLCNDPKKDLENAKKVLSHNMDVKFTANILSCVVDTTFSEGMD